jgi:acyl carrier protein
LRSVEPKTRQPLADGQVGEVWISGPHIAQGYWRKPALTEESFRACLDGSGEGPFLRTGDLGFLRDGRLVIAGRIKEVIIVRGRNHYPQDIERTVAQSHPSLQPQSGAAFSVDVDGRAGLVVVQEVRRTALRDLPTEEIACLARQRVLENHELAMHALVLIKPATLPKTSSGKIRRGACRSAYVQGELESVYVWSALDELGMELAETGLPTESHEDGNEPLETRLREWIAHRMGLVAQGVSPDKPFADFGLDTAAAMELVERLEKWLGRPVSATVFWDYPTISALSSHLSSERPATAMDVRSPHSKEPALAGDELDALSEQDLADLLAEALTDAGRSL